MNKTATLFAYMNLESKKSKPHPQPQQPYELTQGNTASIKTSGIAVNKNVVISLPGCTTITLFESFTSAAAQAAWNANQGSNPWLAPNPPTNPHASGLMVVANALGDVEEMLTYPKGVVFDLQNNASNQYSEYIMRCHLPNYQQPQIFMQVLSPDTSVKIPANVFGGLVTNNAAPSMQPAA